MARLTDNWLTEGLLDFEYKKYKLLAWLQEVERDFQSVKVYPSLSDLLMHYQNLQSFQHSKSVLEAGFPKELRMADLEHLKLRYQTLVDADPRMKELEEIVDYSLPELKRYLDEGMGICHLVEESMHIEPIGLVPLQREAGYLLFHQEKEHEVSIFDYHFSLLQQAGENYRTLKVRYMGQRHISLTNTFEQVKIDLVRQNPLQNPATYLIVAKLKAPFHETMLPVAKRKFVRYVMKE